MSTIWVITPYDSKFPETWEKVWENNLQHGFISIGWPELGNVSKKSEAEIVELHQEIWPDASYRVAAGAAKMLTKFWSEVEIGQKVVARQGRQRIAAIGKVASRPYYSVSKTKKICGRDRVYPNHIDIEWDKNPRNVSFDRDVFGMQTIHKIKQSDLDRLIRLRDRPDKDFPNEVDETQFLEGDIKLVAVNAYERNPKARKACVEYHGYRCKACDMKFDEVYGDIGSDFIHVHHVNPMSSKERRATDPVHDLIPVCPNCHAMLHRKKKPLTISELKSIIERNKRGS